MAGRVPNSLFGGDLYAYPMGKHSRPTLNRIELPLDVPQGTRTENSARHLVSRGSSVVALQGLLLTPRVPYRKVDHFRLNPLENL